MPHEHMTAQIKTKRKKIKGTPFSNLFSSIKNHFVTAASVIWLNNFLFCLRKLLNVKGFQSEAVRHRHSLAEFYLVSLPGNEMGNSMVTAAEEEAGHQMDKPWKELNGRPSPHHTE